MVIAREPWQKAEERLQILLRTMSGHGMEIIYAGKPAFDANETVAHAKEAKQKGADCICYVVGTWIHSPQVVSAALEVNIPTILLALKQKEIFSLVGAACARGSLDEIGLPHLFVYGEPDSPEMIDNIAKYARAAATVKKLKGKKYGLVGGRSMGMYTAMADYSQVKRQLGIEIEHIDEYRVILEAEKTPDAKAKDIMEEMKKKYAEVSVDEGNLLKSIKLYLALKKIVNEEGLDFIGIKCQPEVISNFASYCVPVALLNNEGFVTACECDTNAAITMEILHILSSEPVFFGDVQNVDRKNAILTSINCGSVATDLAQSPKEVHWLAHPKVMYGGGSPCVQLVCKPGRVTCARLSRSAGKYHMLIFAGETLEKPREQLRETIWEWPHAFIKMDCNPDEFLRQLRSNHIHFVYGDYEQELIHICEMLDIIPILPK